MRNETLDFRDSMNHRIASKGDTDRPKAAPQHLQIVWHTLNQCEGPEDYKAALKEFRDRVKRWKSGKLNLK